jgi:quinol monooxygenase YgiN
MAQVLLNKLIAKPDNRDKVVEILVESGKVFDDNPDCLLYLVTEADDDPNVIWVVDLWTNEESHTEALKAPALKPYVDEAIPLLEGMPEQIKVRAAGGKGLPD